MELRPGYKQTEVGVIPEDWEIVSLGDSCKKVQDGNYGEKYPKSSEFLDHGTPFLTSKAIGKDGFLKESLIDYISLQKHSELSKAHIELYDVLFTNRGASVGAIGFVDHRTAGGNIGPQLTLLRSNPDIITPRYLLHSMKSFAVLKQIQSQDSGSAMNFFGITATKKFVFPLPPTKAEQETIAEALSDTDALIESLEQLITKKRHIKQGAMQELLTGKKRLPGFSGEWEVKRLGDVLKVRHGKSQHNVVVVGGKYPILASGGEIGRTNEYLYDKHSVLIGRKGTIDAPQFIDTPFWTIDTLFFTEIAPEADVKFIFYKFNTINWRSYNEASGVPSLSASRIENIDFSCPPFTEQTAIATILSDMDAEITALETKLAKTRQLKQGMMHNLLTGKIRLNHDS